MIFQKILLSLLNDLSFSPGSLSMLSLEKQNRDLRNSPNLTYQFLSESYLFF